MSKRWWRKLSISSMPISWKMTLAILAIFIFGQVLITLVGDRLVRASLVADQERELLERAVQHADLLRDFRDDHLIALHSAAERNSGNWQHAEATLRSECNRASDFSDFSLVGTDGIVFASSHPELEGEDLSAMDWFPEAQQQRAGLSRLYQLAPDAEPVFYYYVPTSLEGVSSDIILVARMPASVFWTLTDRLQFRDKGYAFVVDDNAVLIAHGVRDAQTGLPSHQFIYYAVGDTSDPLITRANVRGVYGTQQITQTTGLPPLASFLRQVGEPSLSEPGPNVYHYYWDVQASWKTVIAVPVGEPVGLDVPHHIAADDWIFAITVMDDEFLAPLTELRRGLFIASTLIGLFIFAYAIAFGQIITRPIRQLANLAAQVTAGDYGQRLYLRRGDELGQLAAGLNAMLDRLTTAMEAQRSQLMTLLHTADGVQKDAETISAASEELAAATAELDATAEEVARTVQSMAQDAYDQMTQVQRTAEAIQQLDQEIQRVTSLADTLEGLSLHVRTLAEETEQATAIAQHHSQRIASVVRAIEKFSRQTNMLSLNAIIEATRAGDMGDSFTVVADEVRRLSENSRQSLGDIDTLNRSIRESITTINGAINLTRTAASEVVQMAEEMAHTAERQASTSHSLIDIVNNLAAIAEKNAAAAEQLAAATEEQTSAFQEISAATQDLANLAMHLQALARNLNK
ncbi:MAG: methyl-accepting chemotaxis protein [Anaerolineae bacterium]|nr:methyl-accepting chemotaxis protein [Anaerolineae bacterium]